MKCPISISRPPITRDILGLNLIAKEKDAVYLANTVDQHSAALRKGDQAKCTRIGFQIGPQEDLNEFDKQTQKHGVKTSRKKDPEPSISDMLVFEDPKGTTIEVFKRPDFAHQKFPTKGVVPHKLGHVAFHCEDVKKVAQFYIDVLGFRESDWMADFFVFLRCGPDHHTINLIVTGSIGISILRSRCATGASCRRHAISSASTAIKRCGDRVATA